MVLSWSGLAPRQSRHGSVMVRVQAEQTWFCHGQGPGRADMVLSWSGSRQSRYGSVMVCIIAMCTVNLVKLATDKTLDFYYTVITNDLNESYFVATSAVASFYCNLQGDTTKP